ncbi:MAG: hypothetical protein L3J31_03160 [Bacteroidales bacterium]|nr:hypothetical protein [Bacteroidales bacterium]MCF6341788.1 hypothetical protein [Bacteroidales bacterium]
MKKIKYILSGIFILTLSAGLMAQGPPNPPGGHGGTGDEVPGGNAPVGTGLFLLLGMGAVYGGRKVFKLKH